MMKSVLFLLCGVSFMILFLFGTPIQRFEKCIVSLPAEKVQYEFYQGECSSSVRLDGNRKVYTFAKNNIMPFPKEPNMVDLFDVAPKLMMSSTPKWQDKSLWFNKTNEDYKSFASLPEAQRK